MSFGSFYDSDAIADFYGLSPRSKQSLKDIASALSAPVLFPWYSLLGGRASEQGNPREFTILVIRFRRLLREVLGEGGDEDVAQQVKSMAAGARKAIGAIVAWFSFIDTLVNLANQRFGDDEELAQRHVKAAVRTLYKSRKVDMPHIPYWVEPIILDITVSVSVDVLQFIAHRYGLWPHVYVAPKPSVGRKIARFFLRLWVRRVKFLIKLFGPIYQWFSNRQWSRVKLSPEILQAIAKVEEEGLIFNVSALSVSTEKTVAWLRGDKAKIRAFIELVVLAINEAERFDKLSGREKQRYAKNLIFAVIEDMGIGPKSQLMTAVINRVIDTGIEVFVHLFRKHRVFASA